MPWSEVSPMDQRLQLVAEYLTGSYSMTELAAAYGVSRRIGYYWVQRYHARWRFDAAIAAPAHQPGDHPRRPRRTHLPRAAGTSHLGRRQAAALVDAPGRRPRVAVSRHDP